MKAILMIAITYALCVWEGFAIKVLWGWFLVPQFGFPPIGIAHAVGISVLAGLLTHQAASNAGSDERTAQVLAYAAVSPLAALLVGWIVTKFL